MLQFLIGILWIMWGVNACVSYLAILFFLTLFISVSVPLSVLFDAFGLAKFVDYSCYLRIYTYICNVIWSLLNQRLGCSAKVAKMLTAISAVALAYAFLLSMNYLFVSALNVSGGYKLFLLFSFMFYMINFELFYELQLDLRQHCLSSLSKYLADANTLFSTVVTPALCSILKMLDTPRELTLYKAIKVFFALVILGIAFELSIFVFLFWLKVFTFFLPASFYSCLSRLVLHAIIRDLARYYRRIITEKTIFLVILLIFITIATYTIVYHYYIDAMVLHVCYSLDSGEPIFDLSRYRRK